MCRKFFYSVAPSQPIRVHTRYGRRHFHSWVYPIVTHLKLFYTVSYCHHSNFDSITTRKYDQSRSVLSVARIACETDDKDQIQLNLSASNVNVFPINKADKIL